MAVRLGFGACLGVGIQSVWNTSVARTLWFPLVSESLARTLEKSPRNTLTSTLTGRASRKHFVGADNCGGGATVLLTYEGFGVWWKHILGAAAAPTGPVGGLYTHVYSLAMSLLPGLTLECVRGTGASEVFTGMKAGKASFKIEVGKEATATFDFIGLESGGRVSAATPSLAASRDTVVLFDEAGQFSFDGNGYTCTGMELTVDHKLARRPQLGTRKTAEPMPSGMLDIVLRVDLEPEDDALTTAYQADTEGDASIEFVDSAGRTITIALSNCYIESASDPITTVGVTKQTVTIRAQATASSEGITATVINTQATSLAA